MGLDTHEIFYRILSGNDELMELTKGGIYSIAIPEKVENIDSSLVPWVIITFDGLNNEEPTKDDPFESSTDTVQIGIEVAANSPDELTRLSQLVRDIIHDEFLQEHSAFYGIPDYRFSAGAMQYDDITPCYFQNLNYSCSVDNVKPEES